MGFIDELNGELNYLQKMQAELSAEKQRPEIVADWKMHLRHKRAKSGKNYFYNVTPTGRWKSVMPDELWSPVYIQYLKESSVKIEKSIAFLQYAKQTYREFCPDNIYKSLKNAYGKAYSELLNIECHAIKDTDCTDMHKAGSKTNIFLPYDQIDLNNGKENIQCGETFKEESLRHTAGDGTRVRSKSEASIADHLRLNKLEYQYEPRLQLGDKIIRPDFGIDCIKHKKVVYWEHMGMMGDPVYAVRAAQKLSLYLENGFVPFDNLIITREWKGSLNTAAIQKIIELVLL